jgi:HSP20 family protein
MAIVRWNPAFSDVLNIHSELDRVFNEMMEGWGMMPRTRSTDGNGNAQFLPVDVFRKDGQLHVEASVPGYKPEEVEVTVDGGILTIRAEKRSQTGEEKEGWVRRERYVGAYLRQIPLGDEVQGENATATFENGVLRVSLPLATKPEPKKIPVAVTKK